MKALILEDEPLTAKRLKTLIYESNNQLEITEVIPSVAGAFKYLDHHPYPDLIFSDIQLSDGLVFELFEKYELEIPVIITTAFSEYAIQAIKLSTIDYLLKPVGPKELSLAIAKAIQRIEREHCLISNSMQVLSHNLNQHNGCKKLLVNDLKGCFVVNVDEILKCVSDKNYTTFYLKNGRTILSSRTLKDYEQMLPSQQFIRVHKSFLVNINQVVQYVKGEGGAVVLTDGSEVEVSRRKKTDLLQALMHIQ